MLKPKSKKVIRAFTLIELLIVVAIIAILAAIAIPNFLEAQIRAKVAHVLSDFRVYALALESYHVDHSKYPPTPLISGDPSTNWIGDLNRARATGFLLFRELTTPIAYVTSLLYSPFKQRMWGASNVSERTRECYFGHAYRANARGYWPCTTWVSETNWDMFPGLESRIWWLGDVGPNNQWDNEGREFEGLAGQRVPYDPTNGTISLGNIYKFGP